jgi:hypothetical protein
MKKPQRTTQRTAEIPAESGWLDRPARALGKIEPWFPWTFAALFLIVMAYLTFRYHTVGGLGVETDFYAELYPPADKLLHGHFSPLNYSAKGPVYSILLAGMYLIVRDFFTAGLLINLLCAAGFGIVLYFLVRMVFNRLTAAVVMVAALLNYQFLGMAYQAGSDIPFMLACGLSMFFLFRDRGKLDIALSAVFGLLAFLTRYNGAFLAAGAVLFLAFTGRGLNERLRRAGFWIAVFIVAGLPWFIPNTIATGSPVKNENYVNVMLDFYGGPNYEQWTDALPKKFTGIADIFFYDPSYFTRHYLGNIVNHFLRDLRDLIGIRTSVFVLLGMALLPLIRQSRRNLLYLAFGAFYFAILALVFYNPRFSLFLLAIYLPFAVWPFTIKIRGRGFRRGLRIALVAGILTILSAAPSSVTKVNADIRVSPVFLKELGVALGKLEPDKTQAVFARKPHTAYYAGLRPLMFPDQPKTVEELVAFSRENHVRYILYSVIEAQFRPQFADLARSDMSHPGLTPIVRDNYGVLYRVDDSSSP